MRIAIVGSGAMGSLYGGMLAEHGHDVTLIDIWEEHVQAINESGLQITDSDSERTIDVTATTDQATVSPPDVAVLFVKSTHTKTALEDAKSVLTEDVDVLSLQNGLGNPETIAEYVPDQNVIAGVTTHGATLEGPGHVFHAGTGPTTIGRYFAENGTDVKTLATTLEKAGLPTTLSESIRNDIWEKVLINIGINAPTALARVKNGTLTTEPGRRVVESAVKEAVAVAEHEGCEIREDIVDHVLKIAKQTGQNKSSMLQDIQAEQRTEIDRIHAAVVDRATEYNIDVPVNRTLANLIQLTEHGYGQR